MNESSMTFFDKDSTVASQAICRMKQNILFVWKFVLLLEANSVSSEESVISLLNLQFYKQQEITKL